MKKAKEIILNFPLKKRNLSYPKNEKLLSSEVRLKRFYKLTEKLRNDEWHQEYFVIYNSYSLDT